MPAVRLNLEYNELIDMCTYDNRRLSMRCSKQVEGEPVVDLLPRVRYMLRIQQPILREHIVCTGAMFFTHGLIIIPEESADACVRRVAVLNLSEKAVRVCNGRAIAGEDCSWAAVHSLSSSEAGSPRIPTKANEAEETVAAEFDEDAAFYMECSTLPLPHNG